MTYNRVILSGGLWHLLQIFSSLVALLLSLKSFSISSWTETHSFSNIEFYFKFMVCLPLRSLTSLSSPPFLGYLRLIGRAQVGSLLPRHTHWHLQLPLTLLIPQLPAVIFRSSPPILPPLQHRSHHLSRGIELTFATADIQSYPKSFRHQQSSATRSSWAYLWGLPTTSSFTCCSPQQYWEVARIQTRRGIASRTQPTTFRFS